jgi:hypothetical protein
MTEKEVLLMRSTLGRLRLRLASQRLGSTRIAGIARIAAALLSARAARRNVR